MRNAASHLSPISEADADHHPRIKAWDDERSLYAVSLCSSVCTDGRTAQAT